MDPIQITRQEFRDLFRLDPPSDVRRVVIFDMYCGPQEYIFIDSIADDAADDIKRLEEMYDLNDPRNGVCGH